jgi:hypothetical protein
MTNPLVIDNPIEFITESINELLIVENNSVINVQPEINVIDIQPVLTTVEVFGNPTTVNIVNNNVSTYVILEHTNGQTIFTLPTAPTQPNLSQLDWNGVKTIFGVDYTITDNVLTWINPHSLTQSDFLDFYFI